MKATYIQRVLIKSVLNLSRRKKTEIHTQAHKCIHTHNHAKQTQKALRKVTNI